MNCSLQRMAAAPPSAVGADIAMVMGSQMIRLDRTSLTLACFYIGTISVFVCVRASVCAGVCVYVCVMHACVCCVLECERENIITTLIFPGKGLSN